MTIRTHKVHQEGDSITSKICYILDQLKKRQQIIYIGTDKIPRY